MKTLLECNVFDFCYRIVPFFLSLVYLELNHEIFLYPALNNHIEFYFLVKNFGLE